MRNQFANTFYEMAKDDKKFILIAADISPAGPLVSFKNKFPERIINTGVAEQIMIGMAAGMALEGMQVFVYTIATFALYRPFEFIRDDLCYQNLPVTIVGIGGGVTYSTLGGTHHAMEDIAIASAIPNMTVLSPCDPLEVEEATKWCGLENKAGPVYLRLGKSGEPILTEKSLEKFIVGKIRYLKKGSYICIISYGTVLKKAYTWSELLEKQGKSVSLISCHTIKPLDTEGIQKALETHQTVYVIEEHVPHGGLGSRIKEIAWDTQAKCQLKCFSLKDRFIHCYGSHDELLKAHGLSEEFFI
ncbi:MAG: transketolase family protein [Gammaproteobacteria bacterium]